MDTLSTLCRQYLKMKVLKDGDDMDRPTWAKLGWRIVLFNGKKRFATNFYNGGSMETKGPTMVDVVSSLMLDSEAGEMSFEEFCEEFGYDSDSMSCNNTWKKCAQAQKFFTEFLGDKYEQFLEASRDF